MRVNDFINKYTIDPGRDIVPNFKKTKKVNIDAVHNKGCFNCKSPSNNHYYPSSPWTSVQHCWGCNHINVIYYQDRMGGSTTDVVVCFSEKEGQKK